MHRCRDAEECLHIFSSFSLVLRLDNSEPLDFGQVAYYNRGLQGDDIQMSNIPGRYWQPCQTLLLIMFIDQTVDKVLLFVNRTSLRWQLWAEGTNGLMQMCFTVENLLIYFIQMVGFCGALSSPHHSGSHHIGDSQWGKQSTRWRRSHEKWWIIAVFLAAPIGQSLKNSLTDCQFFLQIPENDAKRYQRKRSACG